MTTDKTYTTKQVSEILGIGITTIRAWYNGGWLKGPQARGGKNKSAMFSVDDIMMVRLFQRLVLSGLTRSAAAQAVMNETIDGADIHIEVWWESEMRDTLAAIKVWSTKAEARQDD